mmetsp:Transcript_38689/g.60329  ORF Transcript_38689/g.60329 Transcript_38689/m.60329 type:complete len:140 (+) Transcript_38689:95-514(+)
MGLKEVDLSGNNIESIGATMLIGVSMSQLQDAICVLKALLALMIGKCTTVTMHSEIVELAVQQVRRIPVTFINLKKNRGIIAAIKPRWNSMRSNLEGTNLSLYMENEPCLSKVNELFASFKETVLKSLNSIEDSACVLV